MAVGMSPYLSDELLDAIANNTAPAAIAQVYLQLHDGEPGLLGTANPAGETTRQPVNFDTALGGLVSSDGAVVWTGVAATEVYTHYSAWDALTSGNYLWSDTIIAGPVTAGDNFQITGGDVVLQFNLAS